MPVTDNQTATKNTHPHSVHCDRPGCQWRTAHSTIEEAVRTEATHPCPHLTLKRTYMTGVVDERGVEYTPPNRGKSLAEKAWDELDENFEFLMQSRAKSNPEEVEYYLGWCRALAWTIHTWTPHWYPTPDDVTREAVKRREIRLGTQEFSPTPGYQYNPMPPSHKDFARVNKKAYMPDEAAKDEARAATGATKAKPKKVSEADIKLIKDAMAMFNDADEVARMLNIDVNVVKSYV